MKRNVPKEQLSLWGTSTEPSTESVEPHRAPEWTPGARFLGDDLWNRCQKYPLHIRESDIKAMQAWLLMWGKRNGYPAFSFPFAPAGTGDYRVGLIFASEQRWIADLHALHSPTEHYHGEWLVKCIEHVRRFDSGECFMPWKAPSHESTEPRQGKDEDD